MEAQRLRDDIELHDSDVVANSLMNRCRRLSGPNSYTKELGFQPLDYLIQRATSSAAVSWLDLCCGAGLALVDAAERIATMEPRPAVRLVGVDLVDMFECAPVGSVEFIATPLLGWTPTDQYDLITCVHGLHYVGDKLEALCRMATWLKPDGLLVADFDLTSVRTVDGRPAGRALSNRLRRAGFELDTRRHRIRLSGGRRVSLPYVYLGADDRAGPNYNGQPAVHSYYQPEHKAPTADPTPP